MANSPSCAAQYAAVGSSVAACNPFSSSKNPILEIQEINKQMQFLNIEVVDDTALIDTSLISKGRISNNRRQESKTAIAMKKRPQKDWKIKKICAADKKGKKAAYSRAEMMALSLENVEDQTKKWSDVYGALAAPVAAEYDGLVAAARFDRRPLFMDNFSADGGASAMGNRSPLKISVH